MEVASSGDSECGAGRDDVVDRLQGFPALAAVWIVALGSVAGIVIAREGVAREADTGGKYRSGEARQTLYEWG